MFSDSATEFQSLAKVDALPSQKVTEINLLKPSGLFTYHQVKLSKILHGARFVLSVLYRSQNGQRPLLYTTLTYWLL